MKKQLPVTMALLGALLAGCQSFKPVDMDYGVAPGIGPEKSMDYGVYTPPGWQRGERLPLILFLHGGGDNHTTFERYGGHRYFDEQINAGNMPRVILVTPDGRRSFWEDWADGSRLVRTTVVDSVIPAIQAEYDTLPCPEHCHLMGISMGGQGVLRLAHLHSDRFTSVSAISAPLIAWEDDGKPALPWYIQLLIPFDRIFGDAFRDSFSEQDPFNAWVNDPATQRVRLQLLWGSDEDDRILLPNRKLHRHLTDNGVGHDAFEYEGGHKWVYWIPNFGRVVNFLANAPPG
jgi:enterochelin esterase-like enzyme